MKQDGQVISTNGTAPDAEMAETMAETAKEEAPSDAMMAAMAAAGMIEGNLSPSRDQVEEVEPHQIDSNVTPATSANTLLSPPRSPARALPGEGYEKISLVGEGTYGQVFKAKAESSGVLVALKKIRMESEKDGFPVTALREIKLLQSLKHENVVRLHEMMVSKGE